jgi:hypothetical protein
VAATDNRDPAASTSELFEPPPADLSPAIPLSKARDTALTAEVDLRQAQVFFAVYTDQGTREGAVEESPDGGTLKWVRVPSWVFLYRWSMPCEPAWHATAPPTAPREPTGMGAMVVSAETGKWITEVEWGGQSSG